MSITSIQLQAPINHTQINQTERHFKNDVQPFGELLNQTIHSINNQQAEVDSLNMQVITGGLPDLHEAMIAAERAHLQLQLTTQIRNKAVEAYQDIMRIQI